MYQSEIRNGITQYAFGNELAWLRSMAKHFNHAVMIGAGPGVMGMALMEGNPDLNLLVIDIQTCHYAKIHMKEAGIYGVNFMVADSSEYGKDYAGPKLDFLLVDGDHSKEGVLKDIKAWFRHVRPGGILFFHDYQNINDDPDNGVYEALTEAIRDGTLYAEDIEAPGISMVYRKKEIV